MAEGRDLKISILSDIEQFDTDPAAADLESLGDAAREASTSLDDIGDAAKDSSDQLRDAGDGAKDYARDTEDALDKAGDAAKDSAQETQRALKDSDNSFDRYGNQAEETAKKVDSAFDRIARSSRSNMRKVDDDLDRAKKGMDDFKDEAGQSGREAAASFSGGFDDVTEGVQEIAANAFSGFGPIGAAAGIAAAAGLGIAISVLEKGTEKANEMKERMVDLADTIREAGGSIEDIDMVSHLEEWNNEIADNKEWWELWQEDNTTNFEKVQEAAERTGVSLTDMMLAMSGSDAEAGAEIMDDINEKIEEQRELLQEHAETRNHSNESIDATTRAYMDEIEALEENRDLVMEALGLTEESIKQAEAEAEALAPLIEKREREAEAAERQEEAQRRVTESREEAADALGEFGEVGDAYTEAVEENTDKQIESIGEVIAAQEKQIQAQRDWADNMETLYKRGVEEGALAQLKRLGPEGAPLVAMLTDASDAELQQWVTNTGELADEGVSTYIGSITDGQPGAHRAGAGLGQSTADGFVSKRGEFVAGARGTYRAAAAEFSTPIEVDVIANGPSRQQLWAIRSTISNNLGTITVPVAPGTLKASRIRS